MYFNLVYLVSAYCVVVHCQEKTRGKPMSKVKYRLCNFNALDSGDQ